MKTQALTKRIPTEKAVKSDPLIVALDEMSEFLKEFDKPVRFDEATELRLEEDFAQLCRRLVRARPNSIEGALRGLEYLHRIVDEDHCLTECSAELMKHCLRTLRKLQRDGIR